MRKLNVTSHPESRLGSSNVLRSTEKTEPSVLRATQRVRYALFISYFCDITVTVVCVRKRTDALAGSCAEKLERMAGSSGSHPVVLTPADIPGAIPFPRRGKTFSQVKLRLLARLTVRERTLASIRLTLCALR